MRKTQELTANGKVKISFDIPQKLLLDLDFDRKKSNQNRSNWLSLAVMEKLAKMKRQNEENDATEE